jgi:hypothetical protein
LEPTGPFRPEAAEKIMSKAVDGTNHLSKLYRRAAWYLDRINRIYAPTGNTASTDPGARNPFTMFDLNHRTFYTLLSDYIPTLEARYRVLSRAQSILDKRVAQQPTTNERKRAKRQKKQLKKKANRKKRKRRKHVPNRGRKKRDNQKKLQNPTKRGLIRAWDKLNTQRRHVHNAVANLLVSAYDTIVLPEFMTAGMIKRRRKKLHLPKPSFCSDEEWKNDSFALHRKTRTALARYGHFAQRNRILAKAAADPHGRKDVVITTEEWTTKQHPFQAILHHTIGRNPRWVCPNGSGFEGVRDCVGGYGVLLRAITKKEVLVVDA